MHGTTDCPWHIKCQDQFSAHTDHNFKTAFHYFPIIPKRSSGWVMLADWQIAVHNFFLSCNEWCGVGRFGKIKAKPSLALIMALTALDQEGANMSQPAGCMHVFCTGNSRLRSSMQMILWRLQFWRSFCVRLKQSVWRVKWLFTLHTWSLPLCTLSPLDRQNRSAASACICASVWLREAVLWSLFDSKSNMDGFTCSELRVNSCLLREAVFCHPHTNIAFFSAFQNETFQHFKTAHGSVL